MESPPLSLNKQTPRLVIESVGYSAATAFEMIRAGLVNPSISPTKMILNEQQPPQLNVDSPVFGVLQNSGDLYDGFWLSAATYNGIELFDFLQHRLTNRYIPQRIKSGITMLAATGVVILAETGVLNGGTADLNDIPAGVIGALAYQGVNLLGRKLSQSLAHRSVY